MSANTTFLEIISLFHQSMAVCLSRDNLICCWQSVHSASGQDKDLPVFQANIANMGVIGTVMRMTKSPLGQPWSARSTQTPFVVGAGEAHFVA